MKALPYLILALVLVAGVVAFVMLRGKVQRPRVSIGEGGAVVSGRSSDPDASLSPGWF